MSDRITSTHEHLLQSLYYHIGNRGICVDVDRIAEAKKIVRAEIERNLAIASTQWNTKVFVGAANAPEDDKQNLGAAININATQGKYALLTGIKNLGYQLEKITKKTEEGDYEQAYSTGELALQKMLSKNQFNYPGGDPAIRAILKIRELGKLNSAYLNARLLQRAGLAFFLTNYNIAGTLSGRRSSRRHTFGFGANAQNAPKHSDIAHLYRRCWVARPGNILLMADQISAEDWPVSALSENHTALAELRDRNVDRHTKLAVAIFNILMSAKTPKEWKDSTERYLGKKTRHAYNYDMTAPRMSDALAQEGFSFSVSQCQVLLDKMGLIDPNIKGVFHKWVQSCISKDRMLVSPTGRERQFLGARPNDNNSTIFKEAYSWIPQGLVGDNTGFAVRDLESKYTLEERCIIQEGHDSIVQDVPDNVSTIFRYLQRTEQSFNRVFRFHNGIEIQIPIEAEIGYDFKTTVKVKSFTEEGIRTAHQELEAELEKQRKEEESKKIVVIAQIGASVNRVLSQSWHEAFFKCVSPHTEAPDSFLTWSAFSLIGAALKNNVKFEDGVYVIYPNQFIVLVAPPGIGKGTAMNFIEHMIEENKVNPIVNTLSDRITAEKIIERIADGWSTAPRIINQQLTIGTTEHSCLLFSTELRILLSASDWMLSFLEESWSETSFNYQTKNQGSKFISEMCCSMLAASVPDFLRNVNKSRESSMVITGGFSSRCLFIYAENPSKDLPWPKPLKKYPPSKALYDDLLLDLKTISSLRGEFTIDTGARIIFENFLKKNRASMNDDSEAVANFKARIRAHALKLAMVMSVSRSDSLVVTQIDMVNALAELSKILINLEKIFRGAGDSDIAPLVSLVQNAIEKKGLASRRELYKMLYRHIGTLENLDRITQVLEYMGFCRKTIRNKMEYYEHITPAKKP